MYSQSMFRTNILKTSNIFNIFFFQFITKNRWILHWQVLVMCGVRGVLDMVEKTGEPSENIRPWTSDQSPSTRYEELTSECCIRHVFRLKLRHF